MSTCFRRAFSRGISPVVLPVLASLALAACDGSNLLQPAGPAGPYSATTFTTTVGGTTTNVLAGGGSLALVLTPQGTTTGRLVIPAVISGQGAVNSDLTGTWTQSGATVDFDHTADTFVRDMPFTVQGVTLVGDRAFGATRIQVTLTRNVVALTMP